MGFTRTFTGLLLLQAACCLKIVKEIKQSCIVDTDQGRVNLTSLAKTDEKSAAFHVDLAFKFETLYWNPCVGTSLKGIPTPSTQCSTKGEVLVTDGSYCQTWSTVTDASFSTNSSYVVLNYRVKDSFATSSHITLKCGDPPKGGAFQFNGECGDVVGNCFTLTHRACCFTEIPHGPPHSSTGLSVGSTLLIIVAVLLFCYIVGGVLVMKFVMKAEGPELCPSMKFWKSLPLLIKDGVMFVFTCGKATTSSYDSI